jgi:hypothetical protein
MSVNEELFDLLSNKPSRGASAFSQDLKDITFSCLGEFFENIESPTA